VTPRSLVQVVTWLTNPDPAEASTEASTAPASMSENEPEDTRLGRHEHE
jgi:hypothetical protein